ncbi:hypothetical protein F5890DRAFT_106311 [Lentinula detonsa]|uniref:Terpenoid synthase n=1 Tax=Lentinula detonsa TaxID=2804962 RepID=A0AA38PYE0_9AGAR|nr:hypothetical protein F5890DRAFT_106311 [Lentinula detonsa]
MSSPETAGSYQLPDLLLHFENYHELNINNHCQAASLVSEKWIRDLIRDEEIRDPPALSLSADRLASMKLGLLGACSFPSCDLTQLILMMDVWSLIILNTQLPLRSNTLATPHRSVANENLQYDYVELLQMHPVFQRLLPRLSRFKYSTSNFWRQRFTCSVAAFQQSQQKAIDYRLKGASLAQLAIDDYIDFRHDFGGMPIILDLIEAVEGLELDIPTFNDDLHTLRRLVGDIIVLSWDVFSYNIDQSVDNRLNIVSLLQSKRENALVHSIKEAGDLILSRLASFKSLENTLLSSVGTLSSTTTNSSPAVQKSIWQSITHNFTGTQKTKIPPSSLNEVQAHDIARYICALKDCMVGFLNWTYETDMFFGTKGESVKSFGWVFLLSPIQSTQTNETTE